VLALHLLQIPPGALPWRQFLMPVAITANNEPAKNAANSVKNDAKPEMTVVMNTVKIEIKTVMTAKSIAAINITDVEFTYPLRGGRMTTLVGC